MNLNYTKRIKYWTQKENQRKFFDELAIKLNINSPIDWGKVKTNIVLKQIGGSCVMRYYNSSLKKALYQIYPDIKWKNEWFRKSRGEFSNKKMQRKIFDEIAKKYNIQNPSEWKLHLSSLRSERNLKSVLNHYQSSLQKALSAIYPEINWKREWFNTTKGHWIHFEHQKKFFDELALKLGIKEPYEWGKVDIIEHGGVAILSRYNSLHKALQSVYPEIKWEVDWFPAVHKLHWHDPKNIRLYFDDLAIKLGISDYKQWGSVYCDTISENGGRYVLNLFNGSLFQALKAAYPEYEWKKELFRTRGYWSVPNQRQYLDHIASKFKVKKPSDWGKISTLDIGEDGRTIVSRYNSSMFKTLSTVYPDVQWKQEWFRQKKQRGFLMDKSNQRTLLDQVSQKLNIIYPLDWKSVTVRIFSNAGGKSLLSKYGSILNMLRAIYPETKWQRSWFANLRKFPNNFWLSPENQKIFLAQFGRMNQIESGFDWRKVSKSLLRQYGGLGLIKRYFGSLKAMLQNNFPEENWDHLVDTNVFKTQFGLHSSLMKIFPAETIFPNCQIATLHSK